MRRLIAMLIVTCAILLCSSDKRAFTRRDKAFYADPNLINFVRPGLELKITSASIAQDGTITAQFTVSDPKGLPLDLSGVTTPGEISTSWVASYIPKGGVDYAALTTRLQQGATMSANQPAADTGGSITKTGDGQYTYTFAKHTSADFDRRQTVSIGVWAQRDLEEFELGTDVANAVFTFAPDGSTPADVHGVVRTETCNKCHNPLEAHGGARRQVELCVLCHNPGGPNSQTIDPDTGESIDLKVMAHRIHMGEDLPSVQAGKPYRIIGFRNSVNDYSTVVFPADPRNCQMCHETGAPPQGGTAPPGSMTPAPDQPPPHAASWLTTPTMAACGACHDDVNFATGENHPGGPQVSDAQCANCHFPQGELPFDASILGAHQIPQFAPGLPGVVFTIEDLTNHAAGQQPTVTFTLKNKAGEPINAPDMNLLNLVMAGPTADYRTVISESARNATGSNGTYTYTFQRTIPADATGTWTVGIEGYRNTTLLPGTVTAQTVRDVGHNVIRDFSVDGSDVAPHPVEVTNANCNHCHYQIQAHGTIRNDVQYCILCHNPTATDSSQRPAEQAPTQSIDFPVLIHRIHKGEQRLPGEAGQDQQLTPFIVYGFNHSVNDFSEVRFPGDLADCEKCHVNDSEQLPLPASRIDVENPRAFYSPMGPSAAACTACHTSKAAAAHAQLNTSPTLGEACAACHGPNAEFSVSAVHAR
jgi:OmcA/MtrC family decaheme c-type cytochrome